MDTHASAAQHEILLRKQAQRAVRRLVLSHTYTQPTLLDQAAGTHTKKHCIITQRHSTTVDESREVYLLTTTEGGGRLRRLKSTHVMSLFHVPGYLYPPVSKS